MSFECGRSMMCGECVELDSSSQKDVCSAVGHIVGLPQPEDLSYEEMHDKSFRFMQAIVDDDDYVTPEMREAAAESAYQLITK